MEDVVNITVVTCNRLDCTKQCLESILNTTRFPFKLNIVDNGSTDGTGSYLHELRTRHPRADAIHNIALLDANMGVACAYNLGWSMLKTRYYAKIDNDVVVLRDDWLEELVTVTNQVDDVAMVGFGRNTSGLTHPDHPDLFYQGHVGGCVLIPEKAHQQLGYWIEDYGHYGEEDADYGFRARVAGFCNLTIGTDTPYITFATSNDAATREYEAWKAQQRRENIANLFPFNTMLFASGIRKPHVRRKHIPHVENGRYTFREDPDYVREMEVFRQRYLPIMDQIVASDAFKEIESRLFLNFYY